MQARFLPITSCWLNCSQNEHFLRKQDGNEDERITDSCFQIWDRLYHIECQSTPDGSMLVRMFEYDFQIARDHGIVTDYIFEVTLPQSAVLYLRSTENTPNQMLVLINTPGGRLSYPVPVIKMKDYSLDAIFQKKLYFLIPFYLFTFERRFAKMETDQKELDILKNEYTITVHPLSHVEGAPFYEQKKLRSSVEHRRCGFANGAAEL